MAYTITNLIAITKKKSNIKSDLLPNIISSNSGISKDETSTHTITHKHSQNCYIFSKEKLCS